MNREKAMWEDLNSRGIFTVEEAEKAFNKAKAIDFGFLASKIDMNELEKIRQSIFG